MAYIQLLFGGLLLLNPVVNSEGGSGDAANSQVFFMIRSLVAISTLAIACLLQARISLKATTVTLGMWLGWIALSSLWSVDFSITLRASLDMLLIFASLALICSQLGAVRFVSISTSLLGFIVFLSAILSLVAPKIGTMQASSAWTPDQIGSWRGVFTEKNGLGGAAAIAIIAEIQLWRSWKVPTLVKILLLSSAITCLIFAKSSNALIGLASMAFFYIALYGKPSKIRVIFSWILLILIFLIIAETPVIDIALDLLGRDATLNGRSDIWSFAIDKWRNQWVQGHGFAAGTSVYLQPIMMKVLGSAARHSHNGYLEALVETGAVGLSLLLLTLFTALWTVSNYKWWQSDEEHSSAKVVISIISGSMAMSCGDVLSLRLIGGWGIFTWAAVISTIYFPTRKEYLRKVNRDLE